MFAQISKEVLRFFTGPSRQGRDLDVHTWPVCPVLTDQEAFPTGTSTDIEPVPAWIWRVMGYHRQGRTLKSALLMMYIVNWTSIWTFVF